MFKQLKGVLVTSYVGAIALGWLFAQAIGHFASIFSAPISGWLMRREYRGLLGQANNMRSFSFQDALPELVKTLSLLLVGYFLLRWLYFTPLDQQESESVVQEP
ncbi:MAG: hypothetical protein ACRD4F_11430 [Candidatus Angelobacter sp.]